MNEGGEGGGGSRGVGYRSVRQQALHQRFNLSSRRKGEGGRSFTGRAAKELWRRKAGRGIGGGGGFSGTVTGNADGRNGLQGTAPSKTRPLSRPPAVDRTAKSTAVGAGSLFARRMPWAIYFSGPISISLKAARMGRLRRTGRGPMAGEWLFIKSAQDTRGWQRGAADLSC